MVKKMSLLISLIAFAIAIVILLSTSLKKKDNRDEPNKEVIQYIVNTAEQNQKEILFNPVINQRCYFGKDSVNSFMFEDICDSNKIFFYFSERICTPCIDNTIRVLKECFPNYKEDNSIIFISPDYPKRLAEDCYGKKLLTLKTGKLGLPMKEQYPFFFKLNNNLEIISAHVVVKVDFKRTYNYLRKQKANRKRT